MTATRRELNFIEESKADLFIPEEASIFSLQSVSKRPKAADAEKKNLQSKVQPPSSFAYSTTAHKRKLPTRKEVKAVAYPKVKAEVQPETCCVTVFGYTVEDRMEIIKELEKLGEVLEYQEKGKNWLHIKYSSSEQAQNALKFDGCLLSGLGAIIGVKKCEDRDFCRSGKTTKQIKGVEEKIIPIPRKTRSWITNIIEYIFTY